MRCPCCGTEVDCQLLVDLETNYAVYGDCALRFRRQEIEVLHILAHRYPNTVRLGELISALYGITDGSEDGVRVVISKLRRALKPFPYRIATVIGVGWRLDKITDAGSQSLRR